MLFTAVNLGALMLRALFEHWPNARPLPSEPTEKTNKNEHIPRKFEEGERVREGRVGNEGSEETHEICIHTCV